MSLPESHPAPHEHKGTTCPVTGQTHDFCSPQKDDIRSVCPALNAMANHGYIARDGKDLGAMDFVKGLKACYGLSSPLAYLLSFGGFFLVGKSFRRITLHDIGKHNAVEHDASLVHHDTSEGQEYAPIEIDQTLVEALVGDVKPTVEEIEASSEAGERFLMNMEDVARARVRRENECRPVNGFQAKVARGEMAIILGVWETKTKSKAGIPVEWVKRWIGEERLPEGWKPDHVQGLLDVVKREKGIETAVDELRKKEASKAD